MSSKDNSFVTQFMVHTLLPGEDSARVGSFERSVDRGAYLSEKKTFSPNQTSGLRASIAIELNLFKSFAKDPEIRDKLNATIETRLNRLEDLLTSLVAGIREPEVVPQLREDLRRTEASLLSEEHNRKNLSEKNDRLHDENVKLGEHLVSSQKVNDRYLFEIRKEQAWGKKKDEAFQSQLHQSNQLKFEVESLRAQLQGEDVETKRQAESERQRKEQEIMQQRTMEEEMKEYQSMVTQRTEAREQAIERIRVAAKEILASGGEGDVSRAQELYEEFAKGLEEQVSELRIQKTEKTNPRVIDALDEEAIRISNEANNLLAEASAIKPPPKGRTDFTERRIEFKRAWGLLTRDFSTAKLRSTIESENTWGQKFWEDLPGKEGIETATKIKKSMKSDRNLFRMFLSIWESMLEERNRSFSSNEDTLVQVIKGKKQVFQLSEVSDVFTRTIVHVFSNIDPSKVQPQVQWKIGLAFGLHALLEMDFALERMYQKLDDPNVPDEHGNSATFFESGGYETVKRIQETIKIGDMDGYFTTNGPPDLLSQVQKELDM